MKKLLLSFAFALVATVGFSQVTHNVKIKIDNIMEVMKDSNSVLTDTLSFTTASDLEDGLTSTSPLLMRIRSNRDWNVKVNAGSATFGFTALNSGDTDPGMGADVLTYKEADQTAFTALAYAASGDGVTVKSGTKGGYGKSGNTISMQYKATPGYEYPAGTYSMDVVYTVSAQ